MVPVRIELTQSVFSGSGIVRDGGKVFDILPLRKGPDESIWSSTKSESYTREKVICNSREHREGQSQRTSTQQCIPWFDIPDSLIHRVPDLAFVGYRSTRCHIQGPECLCRPSCLNPGLIRACDAGTVRGGGRVSGYRPEKHRSWGGGRWRSSVQEDVQRVPANHSPDHDHSPGRVGDTIEIAEFHRIIAECSPPRKYIAEIVWVGKANPKAG